MSAIVDYTSYDASNNIFEFSKHFIKLNESQFMIVYNLTIEQLNKVKQTTLSNLLAVGFVTENISLQNHDCIGCKLR
eukprot:UN00770